MQMYEKTDDFLLNHFSDFYVEAFCNVIPPYDH